MWICKLLGSVGKFIVRAPFLVTLRCFVILYYQLDFLINWLGVVLIIELPVQRVFVVHVVSLLLFVFQSMFILAEFTDNILVCSINLMVSFWTGVPIKLRDA